MDHPARPPESDEDPPISTNDEPNTAVSTTTPTQTQVESNIPTSGTISPATSNPDSIATQLVQLQENFQSMQAHIHQQASLGDLRVQMFESEFKAVHNQQDERLSAQDRRLEIMLNSMQALRDGIVGLQHQLVELRSENNPEPSLHNSTDSIPPGDLDGFLTDSVATAPDPEPSTPQPRDQEITPAPAERRVAIDPPDDPLPCKVQAAAPTSSKVEQTPSEPTVPVPVPTKQQTATSESTNLLNIPAAAAPMRGVEPSTDEAVSYQPHADYIQATKDTSSAVT